MKGKRAFIRRLLGYLSRLKFWVFPHPDFVKAVHYFGGGWPLNSLQIVKPAALARDMKMIREDGFNTIILVVPWRGFQTAPSPPQYDEFHLRQLRLILRAARQRRLSVIVRVSYSHQIMDGRFQNGIWQAQLLLTDEPTRAAWLDYLETLYAVCSRYSCFRQGFLCWEELWHALGQWQLLNASERREMAYHCGFSNYHDEMGYPGVGEIPTTNEPAHRYYHLFANYTLRLYHSMASEAFPGLGMEFRVDKDPLLTESGIDWLSSDAFYDHPEGRFSYWAPFMGAKNEGETLGADQAAGLLEQMLREVSRDGLYANHVVDQFNFIDMTAKYAGEHAIIGKDQIADFLDLAAPLLRRFSSGYGVWAYRDYRQNVLYNASFCMGMRGWALLDGSCEPIRGGGANFGTDSHLRQIRLPRVAGLPKAIHFDRLVLRVELDCPEKEACLKASINSPDSVNLDPDETGTVLTASIPVNFDEVFESGIVLDIYNLGRPLKVSDLSLYDYTYRGLLRHEDASPSIYLANVRAFNKLLDEIPSATAPEEAEEE